jgi:sirohydrochlorin ferrochelatase
MSRAILLVDHGSRRPEARAVVEAVAAELRERLSHHVVAVAHLEIEEPDVATGIDRCVAAGATEIAIHPYFLAPGMHSTRDLPEQAEAACARHPGVTIRVSDPLGYDPRIVDVVLDRIGEG